MYLDVLNNIDSTSVALDGRDLFKRTRPVCPANTIVDMGAQRVSAAGTIMCSVGFHGCTGVVVIGAGAHTPKIVGHIAPTTIAAQQTAIVGLIATTFGQAAHTVYLIQPALNVAPHGGHLTVPQATQNTAITTMNSQTRVWAQTLGASVVIRNFGTGTAAADGELEVDPSNNIYVNAKNTPIN